MDAQATHSFETVEAHYPTNEENHVSGSSKCCCLLCFLFLGLTLLGLAILVLIFVQKPKRPIFSLHAIQLDSFKLDVASGKEVFISSSMASLSFVTQNPNKVGIRYSSTTLGVLCDRIPVGVIEFPAFYQPPSSGNVTVLMHVLLERLNLTSFIDREPSIGDTRIQIQIIGRIQAQAHILNFSLPKIKVALDCRINVDYTEVISKNGVNFPNTHKALLLSNLPHLSQKCSLALCI